MNFELEAQNAMNLLKNMNQKMKITRQNQYSISKESLGLMLISGNPETLGVIMHCNKNLTDFLGFRAAQLNSRTLNFLIPPQIAQIHDRILERYLSNDHNRFHSTTLKRVWMKKADGSIIPVKLQIQTAVSSQKGIILVAFVNPFEEIVTSNLTTKPENAHILLADEFDYVFAASGTFKKKFMKNQTFSFEDLKLQLSSMFININTFSEEELKNGVRTQFVSNY